MTHHSMAAEEEAVHSPLSVCFPFVAVQLQQSNRPTEGCEETGIKDTREVGRADAASRRQQNFTEGSGFI